MANSRLKIEAESLGLELTGESDYVVDAYDALRPVLMNYLERHISPGPASTESAAEQSVEDPVADDSQRNTDPMFRQQSLPDGGGREKKERVLPATQLEFVVCTELYFRVSALPRKQFGKSFLGQVLEPEALSAVYVDRETGDELRKEITVGKTLWRELTEKGRSAVHGDSS